MDKVSTNSAHVSGCQRLSGAARRRQWTSADNLQRYRVDGRSLGALAAVFIAASFLLPARPSIMIFPVFPFPLGDGSPHYPSPVSVTLNDPSHTFSFLSHMDAVAHFYGCPTSTGVCRAWSRPAIQYPGEGQGLCQCRDSVMPGRGWDMYKGQGPPSTCV